MKSSTLLRKVGINPDEPVLLITAEEAIKNLLDAIKEYCPHLKIDEMTKQEIENLLDSYSNCIVKYHPENYHQERAALLDNIEVLRHYGLADDDCNTIDFY